MGTETMVTYNQLQLVGMVAARGKAWHYREDAQGDEPNHYDGAIPVADVIRRLFNWKAVVAPVAYLVPCELDDERMTGIGPDGFPFRLVYDDGGRRGQLRSDNDHAMGVFKSGYQGHDYEQWLLTNVANLIGDDLVIGTAGLVKEGAVAYVQIEAPESISLGGQDFRPFILANTSFDGSTSTEYAGKYTRVLCDNTFAAARSEGGKIVKIRHSKYSNLRIQSAQEALGIVHQMSDALAAEVEEMTNTVVTNAQFEQIIAGVFDEKAKTDRAKTIAANRANALRALWATDERVAPWTGTAWGVAQAFSTYNLHNTQVKKGARREVRIMENVIAGNVAKFDDRVLAVTDRVLAPV
jgi:phage/plasmid-like protein (TIGR03299 family)